MLARLQLAIWIAGGVGVACVARSVIKRCCQMSLEAASSTNVIGVRVPRSYVTHAVRVSFTSTNSHGAFGSTVLIVC